LSQKNSDDILSLQIIGKIKAFAELITGGIFNTLKDNFIWSEDNKIVDLINARYDCKINFDPEKIPNSSTIGGGKRNRNRKTRKITKERSRKRLGRRR
jgi:hypothetical protein